MSYEATPTLEVADSKFLGFTRIIATKSEAKLFQSSLKKAYPNAAHIPICWVFSSRTTNNNNNNNDNESKNDNSTGFDEDGEPENSCGMILLKETEDCFGKYINAIMDTNNNNNSNINSDDNGKGLVLAVVRFFGHKFLGVTCGRLSQCYQSIAVLTLHRFFHGRDVALHQHFDNVTSSQYGMGAGDCELILNILSNIDGAQDPISFPLQIANELDFGGFKGNLGEELPRLQNLQADVTEGNIPVYRYPGNYKGDEWKTFQWSKTSLEVKNAVEEHLKPLVDQEMNHCVSNFYRDGNDFIDHHSDKDLDLNKAAVIVSVSLGDERYLELKRRAVPRDTIRIKLPHGSMLVLGPKTNKTFTHSILKKEGSDIPRMSLTLRHVVTFMDLKTRRLFGEGTILSTRDQLKKRLKMENILFAFGCSGVALLLTKSEKDKNVNMTRRLMKDFLSLSGLFALSFASFRQTRLLYCQHNEERRARAFFSKTSVNGTKY